MVLEDSQTLAIIATFLLLAVPGGWFLAQGASAQTPFRRGLARIAVVGCVVSFAIVLHAILA